MNGRFVTVLVLVAALSMMLASVAFAQGGMNKKFFEAELKPLNHSGASGHADLTKNNGKLKVNTGGGELSAFYMWGMTPLSEGVIQARGQGGERQVPEHDFVLVTGNGGVLNYHGCLILSPHAA